MRPTLTVGLYFLTIPDAEFAIRRVERRVRFDGHDIPAAPIRRRFQRRLENLRNHYLGIVDEELLHRMHLLLIRANPDVFEAASLNRVFQYYRNIGVFISICSRSVNQSSINQAKLKAVEVPLPPLPESWEVVGLEAKADSFQYALPSNAVTT